MLGALALTLIVVSAPSRQEAIPQEERYAAYWLSRRDTEYQVLLITRLPLGQLSQSMAAERATRASNLPPWHILEGAAVTITTYQRDSIWNVDSQPLKPLTSFEIMEAADRAVELDGIRYRLEECSLEEAVRLLKTPEGTIPIHRIYSPLHGMEQTAKALRLLLEDQMKADESKKK